MSGVIQIANIRLRPKINQLSDVDGSSPFDGSVLTYEASSQIWQKGGGNSNNWNTAYTTVTANSANWQAAYVAVDTFGLGWESTKTTVQTNSATTWNYQGTDLKSLSGNWENTYTTVQNNSANWDSAFAGPTHEITSSTTATSYTNGTVIGLSITPGAGTYVAMAKSNFTAPGNNQLVSMTIRQNGTAITHSDAEMYNTSNSQYSTLNTQAVVTVADGQAIDVINTSGTTRTFENRSLILIKVAP